VENGEKTSRNSPLERALRDCTPRDIDQFPGTDQAKFMERVAPHPERETERAPTPRQRGRGNSPIGGED